MNKNFWMRKVSERVCNDGDATFVDSSKLEAKRSHNWFVDSAETELFPNKKQAVSVQDPNRGSNSGISSSNISPWGNTSSYHSVPNRFINRLFGSESFLEKNMTSAGTDNVRKKVPEDHFVEDASVALSMSHSIEDSETCFSYGGVKKLKVNLVKDTDNGCDAPKTHNFTQESSSDVRAIDAYNRENEVNFMPMGQSYEKEYNNAALMGHTYNSDDTAVRSTAPTYSKGNEIPISVGDTYGKEDPNLISFCGFSEEHEIVPVSRPIGGYVDSYHQTSEMASGKQLDASNVNATANASRVARSRPEAVSRSKPELKASKKEAPNSFPSNVRSLISTGMLDGVPVKYVSLSREELRGIIKGSGYLCGCQSCDFSKVLNAYEFERHAGCKTKHPNNHIYFENGKTIYQIVQELRSTPESSLFDTIQTVFGAPINQKSFRIWKESFQAATLELERIYGKEELNL